ncbi:hypothetical protein T484DRAFT_2337327 [Baffinella frigidus]|nr:hypothetical protein T484DRAFT_2337327 [Cryptophyta sp. CCMP2293]
MCCRRGQISNLMMCCRRGQISNLMMCCRRGQISNGDGAGGDKRAVSAVFERRHHRLGGYREEGGAGEGGRGGKAGGAPLPGVIRVCECERERERV